MLERTSSCRKQPQKQLGFETLSLHAGQVPDPTTGARAVPIYQTTSYQFNSTEHAANLFGLKEFGNIYTRIMNPTTDVLEQRIAQLEGGVAALAFASGQSAETLAILNIARAGDEIVSTTSLYGGTYNLFHYTLPKLGITVKFVESEPRTPSRPRSPTRPRRSTRKRSATPISSRSTSRPWPMSPTQAGVPLILDNTMPTPYLVQPIEHGADIVIHSLTKFIGGHGTSIGGIVVDGGNFDWGNNPRFKEEFVDPDPSYHGLSFADSAGQHRLHHQAAGAGPARHRPGDQPVQSFLILQGVETLPLRMERHSQNALQVARFLNEHPKVSWVNYPGLPGHPAYATATQILAARALRRDPRIRRQGWPEAGKPVVESVKLFSHLANIGDAKSLIIHPATTTHSQFTEAEQASTGVTPDFIRLSVGTGNGQRHDRRPRTGARQGLAGAYRLAAQDGQPTYIAGPPQPRTNPLLVSGLQGVCSARRIEPAKAVYCMQIKHLVVSCKHGTQLKTVSLVYEKGIRHVSCQQEPFDRRFHPAGRSEDRLPQVAPRKRRCRRSGNWGLRPHAHHGRPATGHTGRRDSAIPA